MLRALLEDAPIPMIYWDAGYTLRWINKAFVRVLRRPAAALLDQHVLDVLPTTPAALLPQFEHVLMEGAPLVGERVPFSTRRGTPSYWTLGYTPVLTSAGAVAGVLMMGHEITAQVMARQHDEAEHRRLQAILDALPIRLAVWSADHELILTNAAGANYWRRLGEPAIEPGKPVAGLSHPDGRPVLLDDLLADGDRGPGAGMHGRQLIVTFPDGATEPMITSATTLPGADGQPQGFLFVGHDPRSEWELQRLTELAQALETVADLHPQVLAVVSHELRTPLMHVIGYAEALRRQATALSPAEHAEYLDVILSASGQLDRLIGDLLDPAQIEAGGLPLLPGVVDLPAIAARVVDRAHRHTPDRAITLALPLDFPPVPGDAGRIEQVVENLVGNALRHAPGAAITVGGRVRRGEVELWVQDTGPGFSPELLRPAIAPATGTRSASGGGLGLAICRGIVEAHGGRFWVATRRRGAAVHLALPRRRGQTTTHTHGGRAAGAGPVFSQPAASREYRQ